MKRNNLENDLIGFCAPTLAGIKSASLFRYISSDKLNTETELMTINSLLNERGVYVEALLWNETSVLIYAYRKKHLQKELDQIKAIEIMQQYGYQDFDVENCISHLKERLYNYSCFPHEIGLFLGYPPDDVQGFIDNKGKNCKYCGVWKVYCNENEKIELFKKFKKCTEVYLHVFSNGRKIEQMTVCV